jgi:ubiquinone biosynthesis protein
VGSRPERLKRALEVTRVARRNRLLRVLGEIGLVGDRPATREGAREFRLALEELGTAFVKLGQLLSSRPDLLPDVYIEELSKLVDEVPPIPFAALEGTIRQTLGDDQKGGPEITRSRRPQPTAAGAGLSPAGG